MGGCVAPNCHNSSAKGYIMKVFPRNPQRRALWLQKVDRKNWKPTNTSYLCEVHFAPEMWESERCDNKRKLRINAIPTIFVREKDSIEESYEYQMEIGAGTQLKESLLPFQTIQSSLPDVRELLNIPQDAIIFTNENSEVNTTCTSCETKRKEMKTKDLQYKKLFRRQQFNLNRLRKNNEILRYKLKELQAKADKDKYKKALTEMFTEDQVEALFTKTKQARNWSNETIQRALLLKFACGVTGYEELHRLGMPLPSLRTLRRKLLQFEPGVTEKVF